MPTIFIDSSALVAFFDRADEMHLEALSKMEIIKRNKLKLFLTNFIFDDSFDEDFKRAGFMDFSQQYK